MDIKLIKNDFDEFTIGIENGDFIIENGFDTAINISLFSDARAPADSIEKPENRRGWLGDLEPIVKNRKFGSLLWLLDQSRLTQDILNSSVYYSQLALNWLVEDSIAKSIEITGEIIPRRGIQLTIIITAINGNTTTHYRELWELTGNDN